MSFNRDCPTSAFSGSLKTAPADAGRSHVYKYPKGENIMKTIYGLREKLVNLRNSFRGQKGGLGNITATTAYSAPFRPPIPGKLGTSINK